MVRRALAVLLLVLAASADGAQLVARLDARVSRLGEPVTLHIEARGPQVSLEALDLDALGAAFEVFNLTRSGGENHAQVEATLYPLRSGVLTIPPLAAAGARSKPLTLTVEDDPDLSVDARFVPDTIFERQGSRLTLTVRDQADRPWALAANVQLPGLLLRPLGERQFEDGSGPQRVSVRELRWAVLGLKADHYGLRLPMLEAYQLGRRLRLPLPVAPLAVHALPAYLPVAVPVGRPGLRVAPLPASGEVGQVLNWKLSIAAPGITPEAARTLLRLPEGARGGLRFYPARFREDQTETGEPLLGVEIPVLLTAAGRARLPPLSLPYFDPSTQRMEALPLAAVEMAVTDPFWRRLAGLGAFVVLLVAGGAALYAGRVLWERRQRRRAALQRVAAADTPAALAQAVCAWGTAPPARTLRLWLARQPRQGELAALAHALEYAHYGRAHGTDLADLRGRWLAALERRRLT